MSERFKIASKEKRVINFVIDLFAVQFILVLFLLIGGIIVSFWIKEKGIIYETSNSFPFLSIYMLYYVIAEHFFNKTLGKRFTKTKVVNIDGSKPSLEQIVMRSVSRFIIIEIISYFKDRPIGWHDKLSKTLVIEDHS
ncbi:RDD family protein [Reichenbachiella faecimaris]|nr:RDD family protein [Reichenbachiella faecimaris]